MPLDADDDEISYFRKTPRQYVNYRIAKEISGDNWFGNASPEKRRRAVEIERAWDGVSYPRVKLLGFLSRNSNFSM